ncbi:85/88 kDa calcium-independent phospholipase A2-like isoform X1 [Ctenocephalides felis]|uniref:85/88 kDa calcium-independent phospholipase A2-like isoform X1 n=1 Tax=Ctenocephalides felis TaxID=7515 RepID=UPI000E6E1AC9|nr:85/88 kDa calcium-independent phospholipase A2-like isoform X1 [Ctenocephalides felis]XP_026463121.1 85/88 kDa calcium-independent phospholipase A2-like isoform X1 [Ctenocephalides felis]
MDWLDFGALTSGLVFGGFLSGVASPTKILAVSPEQYTSRNVLTREDAIVLYGPPASDRNKNQKSYEIVLHRPCTETLHQSYSVFRSDKRDEADQQFLCYKDKLPIFIDIAKSMCHLQGIQKICDALTEHPSWTLAHLAAYFGCHETFTNHLINSHLNTSDETGMSPLQVAIKTNNLKTVQMLISAKSSLEHLDNEANTVFHYAAGTNKDIIMALSDEAPRCLNSRNAIGHTPLHVACLANKPDCVKALLLAGADVNIAASRTDIPLESSTPGYVGDFLQNNSNKLYPDDMKLGGTPLHWCCSREVIETLIGMGCDIDAFNFEGRTALHVMVLRNRLECAVALLSREANPNIADYNGDTPLHLAVQQNLIPMVQCLVVFGADLNFKNNKGETPRHVTTTGTSGDKVLHILHSVGAERCLKDMEDCKPGCKFDGDFDGQPPPSPLAGRNREIISQMLSVAAMEQASLKDGGKQKTFGGRLLSLDGGGIRGLVLVQLLLELEKVIKAPILSCFDWVGGTSTGGILALALASGKTLKECLCLYFRMKELAFVGGRPYPSEALENILKESLGTDTVMADIKHPKILITGVLADRKPVDLHLFRNYPSPSTLLGITPSSSFVDPASPEEQLLWQAARATGAAPSYFRAFGRFLDGGLIANNPTLDCLTEIHEYNLALQAVGRGDEAKPVSLVVSIGTGLVPVSILKEIDLFRPESVWDTARLAIGISAIGNLLVDQATASDGRVVDRARAWCSMIGVPYFRFSPQLSEEVAMDEKNDEKLVNMLWEAKAYMHSNYNVLVEIADLLKAF